MIGRSLVGCQQYACNPGTADFLDAQVIDEFVISVVPVFIGEGIPLIARRHRETPLTLKGVDSFDDGLVQLHYLVQRITKRGCVSTGSSPSRETFRRRQSTLQRAGDVMDAGQLSFASARSRAKAQMTTRLARYLSAVTHSIASGQPY